MNWRTELIDFALDQDTDRLVAEQRAWIAAEPTIARPYYHLGVLYRMQAKREAALGLLLEAVRLEPDFAPAHVALAEMYAVSGDNRAAWRHARAAEAARDASAVQMLERHGVRECEQLRGPEPPGPGATP